VLVVDDDEHWREQVSRQLADEFDGKAWVQTASSIEAGLKFAEQNHYDLVFMDIVFGNVAPGSAARNGIEAAQLIWGCNPQAAIIIMSSQTSEGFVRQLNRFVPMDASHGWIVKADMQRDLGRAVRAVIAGDCWQHHDVEVIQSRVQHPAEIVLDRASYEVLLCVVAGLDNFGAAARLNITVKAVEKRLQKLSKKLTEASVIIGDGTARSSDGPRYNERCKNMADALLMGLVTVEEMRAFRESLEQDSRVVSDALRLKMRYRIDESGEKSAAKVLLKLLSAHWRVDGDEDQGQITMVPQVVADGRQVCEFFQLQSEQWQLSMCLLIEEVVTRLRTEFVEAVWVSIEVSGAPAAAMALTIRCRMRSSLSAKVLGGELKAELSMNRCLPDTRTRLNIEVDGRVLVVKLESSGGTRG
jgi:DNA-binding NarL/FixJ family response regulator